MKRAKLSFSNIILITACLVVVVSILFLNVINTRNIITLKNSIDTLSIENKNISLLRSASDELVELELVYNKYLQTGEASLIDLSSKLVDNTLKRLINLQQESDSGRAAQIVHQLAKERPLPAMIADFQNLSSKFKKNQIGVSRISETDSVNILLAQYNQQFKRVLIKEDAFRENLNQTIFKNAVTGTDVIQKFFWISLLIILFIVGVLVYNIYKMVNYENEILEAREKAVKLAQVKSRFLSNMSHEIRSPLTAIMGFTEIIDKIETDAEKRNFLHAIKTSSEHLLSTVNDVLDFSKLDAGKLKLEKQPFYIKSAIEEVSFALSSTSAAKKGIRVNTVINLPESLLVKGDLFRLKQILYNLLSNAIKFTEKGGVTIDAVIASKTPDKAVIRIAVADTGIGIPNDQIKTVFEEFTQVSNNTATKDNRRAIKGTGLGLSICKMLVELQGGTIGVESKLNHGSVFTFSIPYELATEKVDTDKEQTTMTSISPVLQGKKALVIEDNDVNIMLLTMLLKKVGIVYDIAKDGELGLQMFKENVYDIILTDINVPKLTGDEIAVFVRQYPDEVKRNMPIVGLTATIVQDDLDDYLAAGINQVLVKPFKQDDLYATLEKYLA
ncbi:hybrid sensor histidine kinase/response regulator [Sediminibacterium sp. C3]|uniref:hybrid sensor histidine kinase/response regulator n=1 Tax=Sediminibacterium sp. C3 TaxID=1267211 RepID=UPI00041F158C|nr:ATP-binding protein [Sediminibacterium sp. C3]